MDKRQEVRRERGPLLTLYEHYITFSLICQVKSSGHDGGAADDLAEGVAEGVVVDVRPTLQDGRVRHFVGFAGVAPSENDSHN